MEQLHRELCFWCFDALYEALGGRLRMQRAPAVSAAEQRCALRQRGGDHSPVRGWTEL